MSVLGLDVGGASLKAATDAGVAVSRRFPLWRRPAGLADALDDLCRPLAFDRLAVTMTGELCDGFATRAEGVHAILDAVRTFAERRGSIGVQVWQTDGTFIPVAQARQRIWETASANWLATATLVAAEHPGENALLIDVGSTTTDIVPLAGGVPVPVGRTDHERLVAGELVYQGVRRTPVPTAVDALTVAGRRCPVMNEVFATAADVHVLLGEIAADPDDTDTADGRPLTLAAAAARLARTVGLDADTLTATATIALAVQVRDRQRQRVAHAVAAVARRSLNGRCGLVVAAGEGEFLARHAAFGLDGVSILSLADHWDAERSRAACAYAVARLAADAPE